MAGGCQGMIDRQSYVLSFTVVDTSSTHAKERSGLIGLAMSWRYEGAEDVPPTRPWAPTLLTARRCASKYARPTRSDGSR